MKLYKNLKIKNFSDIREIQSTQRIVQNSHNIETFLLLKEKREFNNTNNTVDFFETVFIFIEESGGDWHGYLNTSEKAKTLSLYRYKEVCSFPKSMNLKNGDAFGLGLHCLDINWDKPCRRFTVKVNPDDLLDIDTFFDFKDKDVQKEYLELFNELASGKEI